MAFSDWYELIDKQSMGGQSIINVYHVIKENGASQSDDMLTAFIDTVIPAIREIQSDTLDHESVECRSLSDPLDFATATFTPSGGLLVGTALTTFTVATIQFNRLRTDMKNGQKRFVAGDEPNVAANFWNTPFLDDLELVGDAIVGPWEKALDPGVTVCRFGILKRVCTEQPPPDPCPAYRLPEDDAELVFYVPSTFIARTTVRSQVSRKRLI